MRMKYTFRSLLLSVVFLSATWSTLAKAPDKPNIVVIVMDDLGWNNIGFHNPKMHSPNLDKIARKGVELTRFYTAAYCVPTRMGLLTGKYPDRLGVRDVGFVPNVKGGIPPQEQTLPEVLAMAGYKNRGAFGKWHLGHSDVKYHPLNQGFTFFYGHYNGALDYFTHIRDGELDWHRNHESSYDKGYTTDLLGREAAAFIDRSAKEGPFFAYVAFNATHAPMQAKAEDMKHYGYTSDQDVRGKARKEDAATTAMKYGGMLTGMDRAVGEIVKALEKNGIADNTLIWVMSDNGGAPGVGGDNTPFKGKKGTEWEGGVQNVSFLYLKNRYEGGKKVDELTSYIDVLPTLAKLTGLKDKAMRDGINVLPALDGKKLPERILFLGHQAVVTPQWKYINKELYNLKEDISEEQNVAAANPGVVKKLSAALSDFVKIVAPPMEYQAKDWVKPKEWMMPGTQATNK